MAKRGPMATNERRSTRCPSCGSDDVRRSNQHRFLDPILSVLGFLPLRCEDCNHRFFKLSVFRRYERTSNNSNPTMDN